MIKITKVFYDDHCDRDLEAPPVLHKTKAHYYINPSHPDTAELLSDARFYVSELEEGGWPDAYVRGIARSARALIKVYNRGNNDTR